MRSTLRFLVEGEVRVDPTKSLLDFRSRVYGLPFTAFIQAVNKEVLVYHTPQLERQMQE